ncbi:MAG: methionine--tRNA ligase [Proteobacteria bacterium]|nr:methionine--tRNA ligase [Pseudomonadota bacterium]
MPKPFYVTTPIYYVNDRPHIGTAYSTIAADVLARYQRLRGRPTRFLTGLDEHGQKIERRAREQGVEPKQFVDSMARPFAEAWRKLRCEHDDLIRTTEERHKTKAQALWRRMLQAGDIYLGKYEGWYSVSSEAFYTDKDLLPGNLDPISKKPVEWVREESYFFRLSKYTQPLLEFYERNPSFVRPEARFNEVKSFVREGLRDLSVSRTSFKWGVPVPGDDRHIMYVWLDALTNYISALGGPVEATEAPMFRRFWTPSAEVVHIVGKDILRFHAIYWPAHLMSAGMTPPSQVWAHGWLTVDGVKMSKSLGNFIPPGPLVDALGADVLRYYLMRDVGFGHDGDFSHRNLLARYNGELANGLGNLLQRMVASIVKRSLNGRVPTPHRDPRELVDEELVAVAKRSALAAARHMDAIAPHRALESVWELVMAANRYVDQTAPWALAKASKRERLEQVAYTVLEALRWLAVMVWPFMPDKAGALNAQLGLAPVEPRIGQDQWPAQWGQLAGGQAIHPGEPLFPRIDKKQEAELLARLTVAPAPTATKARPKSPDRSERQKQTTSESEQAIGLVTIDALQKINLLVARVRKAERVPKSDKLVRLLVDLGETEPRQILAGIGQHYEPEALHERNVVVVANLKPREMMGMLSQGMLLVASHGERLALLEVDGAVPPGSRIS